MGSSIIVVLGGLLVDVKVTCRSEKLSKTIIRRDSGANNFRAGGLNYRKGDTSGRIQLNVKSNDNCFQECAVKKV